MLEVSYPRDCAFNYVVLFVLAGLMLWLSQKLFWFFHPRFRSILFHLGSYTMMEHHGGHLMFLVKAIYCTPFGARFFLYDLWPVPDDSASIAGVFQYDMQD